MKEHHGLAKQFIRIIALAALESVLLLTAEEHTLTTKIVGECASRTYNLLYHQHLEPGTPDTFQGYVSALHQMYLMGMSMELKRLGYHMTKLN